jgi:hypothetical protein
MSWRLLVIANETLASRDVRDLVAARSAGRAAQVLVIAPALSGRLAYWASDDREARRAAEARLRTCLDLAYWASDDREARRAAEARLRTCLDALTAAGVAAEGTVGDADPLLALGDALALFPADEVLIATHPPGASCWLEREVVTRDRACVAAPVHHVVVEREPVAA